MAQDDVSKPTTKPEVPAKKAAEPAGQAKQANGLVRLSEEYGLWIHPQRKLVVVDGAVCLREGQLEMFACSKGTKEHESIVAVNCTAQLVHAALEAVGAKKGTAVQFVPEYKPASGPIIDIFLVWQDSRGERKHMQAQQWVKNARTDEEMKHDWVFAGSSIWTDERTGARHYQADGGDMICVSNFPSAMLDLPIESTQSNAGLLFAAFTERIPPLETKVKMVLIPRRKKEPAKAQPVKAKPAEPKKKRAGE